MCPLSQEWRGPVALANRRNIERLNPGDRRNKIWMVYTTSTLGVAETGGEPGSEIQIDGSWCRIVDRPEDWGDWRAYAAQEIEA